MKTRIDKIINTLSSDTQTDELLVQCFTPLGLWLGAFNCPKNTIKQLEAINNSADCSICFRWDVICNQCEAKGATIPDGQQYPLCYNCYSMSEAPAKRIPITVYEKAPLDITSIEAYEIVFRKKARLIWSDGSLYIITAVNGE